MPKKKKPAVFLGDFFWSSVPYDGINILREMEKYLETEVDLLMFDQDIRLNKRFSGNEKYCFNPEVFRKEKSLKTISSWNDFYAVSADYSLIATSTHISPKTRYPNDIRSNKKCQIAAWDVGGLDILTNAIRFADIFFTKGEAWKSRLIQDGFQESSAYIAGSPHYDRYTSNELNEIEKSNFFKKYKIDNGNKNILVCPSNPGSHREQFDQNLNELEKLINHAKEIKANVLLKTYPHDYVFFEEEKRLSGVYKRFYGNKPHYEFLKEKFDELVIIESQDHHSAIMFCDALFNMSGSHIAWETHFSKCKSFSMNYEDKPYFESVSYLKNFQLPDRIYNHNLNRILDIDLNGKQKHNDNEFIVSINSCKRIAEIVKESL